MGLSTQFWLVPGVNFCFVIQEYQKISAIFAGSVKTAAETILYVFVSIQILFYL